MLPNMASLQGDQPEALQALLNWWNLPKTHKDYYNCVLAAPAGTGKTFLTKHFTKYLEKAYPLFTATTNEAVRQLELAGIKSAKTTHSALGLQPSTSQETFKFIQRSLPEDLSNYNLLVIDESSMASMANPIIKHIDKLLIDYVVELGMRVLWLGDPYQLPPIEENVGISPIFLQKYYTVILSKVIRNEGAILEFCTRLRSAIDMPIKRFPQVPKEIKSISIPEFYTHMLSAEFLENVHAGTTKIIVWRNTTADTINQKIRDNLFFDLPQPISKYLPTDKILFITPLICGEYPEKADMLLSWKRLKLTASINTKAEIIKVEYVTLYNISCYKCLLRIEGGNEQVAYIPTNEGEVKLSTIQKQVRIKAATMEGYKKAELWKSWHSFNAIYVKVKHAYAITTHRSQGSTIPTVYVHVQDILCGAQRNSLLAYKMLYTACSRASTNLILIR